jgi:hypothetical protein
MSLRHFFELSAPAHPFLIAVIGPSVTHHRQTAPPGRRAVHDIVILDQLDMLVTSDPVAELDHALADTAARLRAARARGDTLVAQRLAAWIDQRLDERRSFRDDTEATR